MNCPDCMHDMRVWRTTPAGTDRSPTVIREHRCRCGQKFISEDRITRRLTAISGNRGPVQDPSTVPKPPVNGTQTEGLGAFPVQKGGLGVSSLDLSGPNPLTGSLSDLRLDHSQRVDRAREYAEDFLAFWDAIEPIGRRKGDKAEAQKVWIRKGRIRSTVLIAGWIRYRASCGDGYTMDADKWIRHDGWSKEYEQAVIRRGAAKTAGNIEVLRDFRMGKEQAG